MGTSVRRTHLVVKVADAEHLGPEPLVRRERVHSDVGAHLVKRRAERRVSLDRGLVLQRELLERRLELRELRAHRLEALGVRVRAETLHRRRGLRPLLDPRDPGAAAHGALEEGGAPAAVCARRGVRRAGARA
eukprot:31351-Pelagococcus_subviridis.AAC.11